MNTSKILKWFFSLFKKSMAEYEEDETKKERLYIATKEKDSKNFSSQRAINDELSKSSANGSAR